MKKVLLTGGSGYVGSYILKELVNRGYFVNCLIRKDKTIPNFKNVNVIVGDLLNNESVDEAVKGVEAVLHVGAAVRVKDPKINYDVNVIGTRNVVNSCKKYKIRRIVYMSSVSAVRKRKGPYGRTKFLGELEVKKPEIDYTILRPPIIYGKEGQGINNIINYVTKFPFFIPIVGSGNYPRQPVSVEDVAKVTIDVIDNKKTFNKEYGLASDKQISFKNLVNTVSTSSRLGTVQCPPCFVIIGTKFGLVYSEYPSF